ncbi:uncharacterized protein PHALS_08371 [Plasmopara halstedii]|uniref:Uncharacterized protein n=1 Tax=Plasmopara halstedii TaxID=4781 RepID=A0A0P1ACU1_PLAHL|nr:uncharacterized protein PHALS_08371 [Plasmopara halstedii]CEG38289.1 hypothetical protein PHALS_08371 [Plasmopara halstedii]|eukprot:XP_024574658.1 hypothetical protein PHALS_08371 [Plasmopara halstedii]
MYICPLPYLLAVSMTATAYARNESMTSSLLATQSLNFTQDNAFSNDNDSTQALSGIPDEARSRVNLLPEASLEYAPGSVPTVVRNIFSRADISKLSNSVKALTLRVKSQKNAPVKQASHLLGKTAQLENLIETKDWRFWVRDITKHIKSKRNEDSIEDLYEDVAEVMAIELGERRFFETHTYETKIQKAALIATTLLEARCQRLAKRSAPSILFHTLGLNKPEGNVFDNKLYPIWQYVLHIHKDTSPTSRINEIGILRTYFDTAELIEMVTSSVRLKSDTRKTMLSELVPVWVKSYSSRAVDVPAAADGIIKSLRGCLTDVELTKMFASLYDTYKPVCTKMLHQLVLVWVSESIPPRHVLETIVSSDARYLTMGKRKLQMGLNKLLDERSGAVSPVLWTYIDFVGEYLALFSTTETMTMTLKLLESKKVLCLHTSQEEFPLQALFEDFTTAYFHRISTASVEWFKGFISSTDENVLNTVTNGLLNNHVDPMFVFEMAGLNVNVENLFQNLHLLIYYQRYIDNFSKLYPNERITMIYTLSQYFHQKQLANVLQAATGDPDLFVKTIATNYQQVQFTEWMIRKWNPTSVISTLGFDITLDSDVAVLKAFKQKYESESVALVSGG